MQKFRWWRYKLQKWWHDKLPMWVAHRLPRRVTYWCAIRVGVHGTVGKWSNQVVPELTFTEALERWDK